MCSTAPTRPAATVKEKLNPHIATAPASGYSDWAASGDVDLSKFADGSYYIGFRFQADRGRQLRHLVC